MEEWIANQRAEQEKIVRDHEIHDLLLAHSRVFGPEATNDEMKKYLRRIQSIIDEAKETVA